MAASVSAFIAAVLIGWISDQIGRKKTFLIVDIAAIILLPFCYLGMARADDLTVIVLYSLAIAFIGNAGYAPILIFLNERFRRHCAPAAPGCHGTSVLRSAG